MEYAKFCPTLIQVFVKCLKSFPQHDDFSANRNPAQNSGKGQPECVCMDAQFPTHFLLNQELCNMAVNDPMQAAPMGSCRQQDLHWINYHLHLPYPLRDHNISSLQCSIYWLHVWSKNIQFHVHADMLWLTLWSSDFRQELTGSTGWTKPFSWDALSPFKNKEAITFYAISS